MRIVLRWVLYVTATTLLLVGILHLSRTQAPIAITQNLPQWLSGHGQDSSKDVDIDFFDSNEIPEFNSTGDLWKYWSERIHDARPTTRPIELKYAASTLAPTQDHPRGPYSNLVRNSEADIHALQFSHSQFVKELEKPQQGLHLFSGRGIVVVGGGEYFGPAIIGIHMLRRTGSDLPVEIFVADQKEYNAELCEGYLPKLNAKCLVLTDFLAHGTGGLEIGHYQLKSLALLFSNFKEVLLLDSDNIPLLDPEKELFSTEPYRSSQLVVWPDFWTSSESPYFYQIAGLEGFPQNLPLTSSETGQLLIDKHSHFRSLMLAVYYNVHGPSHYYPLLSQGALGQGDKESFMAAAVVLNETYYRVKKPVQALQRHDGEAVRGTAMVQFNPADDLASSGKDDYFKQQTRPAFVHANTPKMNAGHLVDEGDLTTKDGHERLRLFGSKEDMEKKFGLDLENTIWELLVQTGCELHDVIREWKQRDRLCERLKEHYAAVFTDGKT